MNASGGFRRIDGILLGAACACGAAATLRLFGVDGMRPIPAALLAAAVALAVAPLARLLGAGEALDGGRRRVLAAVFAAHLVATLFAFPPEDVANGRPVISLDYAVHYQQVERARDVFRRSHRLHAYDPWFMAGHPGGTLFDIDAKGVETWCALLRFVDAARAFKSFVLLAFLLAPLTIYAGCRLLRYRFDEALFATLLFLVFWHWGRPYAGDFRFAGMFAYLFVSHLSVYVIGLFRGFLDGGALKRFFVVGPLSFLVHPTAAVILPVPFLAVALARRGERRGGPGRGAKRAASLLALWCLVVLAVNAIWLAPMLRYVGCKIPSEAYFQLRGAGDLLAVLARPGNAPALLVLALGAWGFARLLREGRAAAAWGPGAMGLFMLFLAAFGVYLPVVDQMEPGRFLVPAIVGFAPLAGAGAVALLDAVRGRSARASGALQRAAAVVLVLCVPLAGFGEARGARRHTLSTTPIPELAAALDALDRVTDPSARLMIEDGPAWAYGNSHYPSVVPLRTGVEQIGGPYLHMFMRHSFASFQTDRAMGTPLKDLPLDRLRAYLRLYNVRWIFTATPACDAYVRGLDDARVVWSSKRFTLREVLSWNPEGFVAPEGGGGSGSLSGISVEAGYDRILVRGAIDDENGGPRALPDTLILKYHWDKGLRAPSRVKISPVYLLDDPVPFILMETGGEREILVTFR